MTRRIAPRFLPIALLGLLFGPTPALAGVIVVDPLGQLGAAMLQAAIDGASTGDIILVKKGNYWQYAPIEIVAKGITLVNDTPVAQNLPRFIIRDIPANANVVLRRFFIGDWSLIGAPAVTIRNSPGTIWFEACALAGGDAFETTLPGVGIDAVASSSIVVQRCAVRGGAGSDPIVSSAAIDGAPAVTLVDSRLVVDHGELRSGMYGAGTSQSIGYDGAALVATNSTAFLAGVGVVGASTTVPNGSGQPAIHVLDAASKVWVRDCFLFSGTGPGASPPPINAPAASIVQLTEPTTSVEVTSPHRAGDEVILRVNGTPGDLAAIFVGGIGSVFLAPVPYQGTYLLRGIATGPIVLAPIPANSKLMLLFTAAPLPPTIVDGIAFAIQGLILSPVKTLEGASIYVQVAPGF